MFIEYIGIIAIALTALASYNLYRKGKFSKDYVEVEDDIKKQSRFKKCWKQSYIREIYSVRASQRKLICFIPWLGVWISLFFVFALIVFGYVSFFHPLQPFEKLTKYEGVITNYFYKRKVDDILQIKLKDGTIKNFHAMLSGKDVKKRYIGKEVMVLVQKDWGIIDLGYFEKMVWMESDNKPLNMNAETYAELYQGRENNKYYFVKWIILSLKWLIGSLALIWFINRKPVGIINPLRYK